MTAYATRWLFAGLTIAGALCVWWYFFASSGVTAEDSAEPRALIRVVTAQKGQLSEKVPALGTVAADPASVVTLAVERDTRILTLAVRPGDRVQAGAVLMTLGALAADKAQIEQAQSAVDTAEAELARLKRLKDGGLASNDQVAAADKAMSDAQSQLAALQQAGGSGANLTASSQGIVLTLGGGVGQTLAPGTAAATIAEDRAMLVIAGLEPADAARVVPGLDARLASPLDAKVTREAKVASVGGAIDPVTRFVNVTLKPASVAGLMPGATLAVTIQLQPAMGVIIPRSALMEDGEGIYVFTVDAGVAHRTNVDVAFEVDGQALITSGLVGGEVLAVVGVASIADGSAVREDVP